MSRKNLRYQMLDVLEDGEPHLIEELHKLCRPSGRGVVWWHICKLRKEIKDDGLDVLCVLRYGKLYYQLVHLYQGKQGSKA